MKEIIDNFEKSRKMKTVNEDSFFYPFWHWSPKFCFSFQNPMHHCDYSKKKNTICVANIFGTKASGIITTGLFYFHTDSLGLISSTARLTISQLVAGLYCTAVLVIEESLDEAHK